MLHKLASEMFYTAGRFWSSLRLHFIVTRSSTTSGANLFLSGVTILPATEKTRFAFEEAAGMGMITRTRRANLATVFYCTN